VCPDEILERRLQFRQGQGTDVSDGRSSLLANQKADFEPIAESELCEHVVVDTSKDLDTVRESALLSVIETLCPEV
jgi:predicted kinase